MPRDEHSEGATAYASPDVIMDRRADEWEAAWNDPAVTRAYLLQGVELVLAAAREEAIDPIDFADLVSMLPRLSRSKAKGIDNIGPIEVQRLPEDARLELVQLLNRVEETGCWPRQIFATLGAVAPKAKRRRPRPGPAAVHDEALEQATWHTHGALERCAG